MKTKGLLFFKSNPYTHADTLQPVQLVVAVAAGTQIIAAPMGQCGLFWEGPGFAIHLSCRASLLNVYLIQKAALHGGNSYEVTQVLNECAKLAG